ncbi:MAG TPA: hypothetical protein VJL59_22835 [Anaerolineales bacterium]|nr:hypothetical protein [Anaerolineales bacterium]
MRLSICYNVALYIPPSNGTYGHAGHERHSGRTQEDRRSRELFNCA